MSKWCNECHLNKQTGEYMSCSQECPISGKDFEELSSLYIQQFIKSKQGKQLHFKLFKERCSLMPQYNEFDFISNINNHNWPCNTYRYSCIFNYGNFKFL